MTHENFHKKNTQLINDGFQRFRATEDCGTADCQFYGQKTTHFHCRYWAAGREGAGREPGPGTAGACRPAPSGELEPEQGAAQRLRPCDQPGVPWEARASWAL